jgi:hypothetical protein
MPHNPEAVKKLFQEYYILGVPQFAAALPHRIMAEPQHHQAIVDGGYVWDEKNVVYTDPRLGSIVALPNDQFIWMLGNFGKVLKNPDKLNIWVNGRNEEFLSKLMVAMGQGSEGDVSFSGTGERGAEYTPKPVNKGDETDQLIAKLKKQVKNGSLPSDVMIDVGMKAKKDNNEKLLAFLKTVKPMNENKIKRSQLDSLVREIVKGIVKEGWNQQENDELYDLADMAWGKQNWVVKKQKTSQHGTVYQLSFNTPISRFLWKSPEGKWKALDPKTRQWNDIQSVSEMTTTGAVAGYATPFAFKKKKGPMEEAKKKCRIKGCTGSVKEPAETRAGLGGLCAKHVASQVEREKQSGEHSKMINWIHTGKHELPEEKLDEMTTTGDVAGYNVPGAFSKRGGSERGIKGSESLGYTLTPQGKKEMHRPADKLTEKKNEINEASGLGGNFDKAQRAYDNMSPPEDPPTVACDECGEDADVVDQGSRSGHWWWKAVCPHCGHKMEADNF